MKRFIQITAFCSLALVLVSGCKNSRKPGKQYAPDMGVSRAVESYAELDSTVFTGDPGKRGGKIYFNSAPVAGSIKRGEFFPYTLPNDSNGYKMSALVKNPVEQLSSVQMKEAARLYNINCAICHGEKGAANGPLATSGKVGGVANLTLPNFVAMPDGTMFHSITYGKNNMGSYASQLSKEQRWRIIRYIRTLQPKPEPAVAPATAVVTDSTTIKKG